MFLISSNTLKKDFLIRKYREMIYNTILQCLLPARRYQSHTELIKPQQQTGSIIVDKRPKLIFRHILLAYLLFFSPCLNQLQLNS